MEEHQMRTVTILPVDNYWIIDGVNEDVVDEADGRLIAHDLLEHQQGVRMIGDPWDEVIALGGYMFVRGQFIYEGNGLEVDLVSIFESFGNIPTPPRLRQAPCDVDWAFVEGLDGAIARMDDEAIIAYMKKEYSAIIAHMRKGYRMARRRFGCELVAYDLFQKIRESVEEAETGIPHRLSYNLNGTVLLTACY